MPSNSEKTPSRTKNKPQLFVYPPWSPRFWHGMLITHWFQLLAKNGFRIHPLRLGLAGTISCCTPLNSALRLLQQMLYGRKIEQTVVAQPPIFIIGHWRSGTTFLHELLVRDERFAFPTTYDCFAPSHFLVSSSFLPRLAGFLLPRRRPMDNMLTGFDRPQEDEFALASLGCPTPYLRMVFPNEPPCYLELFDMQDVAPEVLTHWKRDVLWFVKALTLHKQKPLILKSPPHTGRVAVLSELFPGARFIHMTRDPYTLFVSTRRLWQALDSVQGLQLARHKGLDEYVFTAFERMYRGFESQRATLDPRLICDLRYEDLIRDPLGQLQNIYDRLDLGGFELVRPGLESHLREQRDYRPNRHEELEPEIQDQIRHRWRAYAEKYGYTEPAANA